MKMAGSFGRLAIGTATSSNGTLPERGALVENFAGAAVLLAASPQTVAVFWGLGLHGSYSLQLLEGRTPKKHRG
jgi:hypothetical protein